jgi:hypothetical protein
MFQFVFGFFYGFVSGLITYYVYGMRQKYLEYKNIKKVFVNKIYNILTNRFFDVIYNEEVSDFNLKIDGIESINDITTVASSIENIIKDYNKNYKIIFFDNKCKIKLLNNDYINNKDFVKICELCTKNNIEINIVINKEIEQHDKIE